MPLDRIIDFLEKHWGDLASLAGFAITIFLLFRTKSAADAARAAAVEARDRLTRYSAAADFAAVLQVIEEIIRLHRPAAWEISLDRYSTARRLLVSIQQSSKDINEEQRTTIRSAVAQLRIMEQVIEKARAGNPKSDIDAARLNKIAAKLLDQLNGVMISIRQVEN